MHENLQENPKDENQSKKKIIDLLKFACYQSNRIMAPNVPVKEWARIYPNSQNLEKKFQERTKK